MAENQPVFNYDTGPAGGRLICSHNDAGFMFVDVPRSPLGREWPGIVGLAATAIILGSWAVASIFENLAHHDSAAALGMAGALIGTLIVVVILLYQRIVRGRQPCALGVQHGKMVIVRPGRREPARSEHSPDQVLSIKVRLTGTNLHFKAIALLDIRLADDARMSTRVVRLFEGHTQWELLWMARQVSAALGFVET